MNEFYQFISTHINDIMWYVRVFCTLVVIFSYIVSGFDDGDSSHHDDSSGSDDHDGIPWKVLLVYLPFAVSWSHLFLHSIDNNILRLLLSILCGSMFTFMFVWIMKLLSGLSQNNTITAEDIIGCRGKVYVPNNPVGTLTADIRGTNRNVSFMSLGNARLDTGTEVVVIAIQNNMGVSEPVYLVTTNLSYYSELLTDVTGELFTQVDGPFQWRGKKVT